MSQWLIDSDSVVVLPTDFLALDVPTRLQIGNDPLHGTLGNLDLQGHVAKDNGWVSG